MAEDSLKGYYCSRAPEYDKVYAKPERQPDLRAIEAWLPTVFAGRRVLEVACGTGYWTQFIAPAAANVLALDASLETLAIGRSRAPMPNVEWVQGDAYALPCATQPFDAAFAGFWISHVPRNRVAQFLAGLHGRLAPGAKVVLLDNLYVPGSSTPHGPPDEHGDTYQDRRLDDGTPHRVLKNFPDEAEVRGWLADCAIDVRFHSWPHYWAVDYTLAD